MTCRAQRRTGEEALLGGVSAKDVAWAEQELKRLSALFAGGSLVTFDDERGAVLPAVEFLRLKAGARSELYLQAAEAARKTHMHTAVTVARWALETWLELVEDGLVELPVEAQARIAAANDLMEQVETLLSDRQVHPAAPVMLAGAALEEMLRSMIDTSGAKVKGKPGINSYTSALRAIEELTAQETKDITSWAGMRNNAAHGRFDQIELANARLLAQGINQFMQKHGP